MQNNHVSTYTTVVNAPVSKVWDALTRPDMVKKYFFDSNLETDWKVGHPIFWRGEYEGKSYVDKGTILEFQPNQRLSFSYLSSWTGMEDKPENYLVVTYEVSPVEGGTRLVISQSNYDETRAKHSQDNWAAVMDGMKKLVE